MGGSVKSLIGALLPVAAALLIPFLPVAIAAFAPLIIGGAGIVGGFLGQQDMSVSDWDAQAKGPDGIQLNTQTTQRAIPIIYGEVRVGSNDVFMQMAGSGDSRRLWIVSALCEGEIEGLSQENGEDLVFVEDQLVSEFNAEHLESEGVLVEYWVHDGTPTQSVDPNITAAIPSYTDNLHDIAYIVYKIKLAGGIFSGIPKRQVVVKGRKLLDYRTTSTSWTKNPALMLYDYMTNTTYGMSLDSSLFDMPSWEQTANYCEVDTYKEQWLVDYTISSRVKSQTVIDTLLAHFRGSLTWFGGTIGLQYSDLNAETVVAQLDDSDIAREEDGSASVFVSQPSTHATPDGVLVKYVNKAAWAMDDIYIGDTTGQIKQIDFPGFTDRKLALDMGNYMLEREQLNRSFSFKMRPSNIVLEVNDLIEITSSELGLTDKLARVIQSDILGDGLVLINIILEDSKLYDGDYNIDPNEVYTVDIADPASSPPPIQNFSVQEEIYVNRGRSFIRLVTSFTPPEVTLSGKTYPWYSHVEVYVSFDEVTWKILFTATDGFQIDPVEEDKTYYLRIFTATIFGLVQKDPSQSFQFSHKVQGVKGIAPSAPLGLDVVVNPGSIEIYGTVIPDPDIDSYEFRVGNDWLSTLWSDAVFLSANSKPAVSFTGVKPGEFSFWLDAKGKNNLYSGSPLTATVTIEDPPPFHYLQANKTVDYVTGSHSNTETVIEQGLLSLRCAHAGGLLSGTYVTPGIDTEHTEFEYGSITPLLVAVKQDGFGVIVAGTTWNAIAPIPSKWNDIAPSGQTWTDLLGDSFSSPKLSVSAEYSDTQVGPWSTAKAAKLELLTGLVPKRYVRLTYDIEDSTATSRLVVAPSRVKSYVRKFPVNLNSSLSQVSEISKAELTLTFPP